MNDLPESAARRLQPPSWRDTRLLVGVLLVLTATVLGSVVVATADDRVAMYAARVPLLPGERLTADRLVRVDVQLADEASGYLPAAGVGPDVFVLREVRPGELVPRSALGDRSAVEVQAVALMVDASAVDALEVGSVVDVYVNSPRSGSASGQPVFEGPDLALERVSVSRVGESGSGFGSRSLTGSGRAVHLMVPVDKIASLIGAVDAGARVTLVPVPGSVTRAAS